MKPLKITIENINSFRDAQTVDFERCVRGENIFCICGDTGSGKTTIFDSMLLALYGKSKRGNLTELINLSADRGRVRFEFEAEHNGKRNIYVSERIISAKTSGNKNTLTVSGETVAEGGKAFELLHEIIGLDREQFTQVALLEQGKFDSFLKCEPAERADVLAKLLGLERFRSVRQITDRIIMEIKGEISGHERELSALESGGNTKERLAETTTQIKSLTLELKALESDAKVAAEKLKALEADKKRHEIFIMHKTRLISEEKRAETLKTALDKMPEFDGEMYKRLNAERERLSTGSRLLTEKESERAKKLEAYNAAAAELKAAREADEKNKSLLSAAAEYIKSNLKDGDECPVCGGTVRGSHESHANGVGLSGRLAAEKSSAANIGQLTERVANLVSEGTKIRDELTALKASYGEPALLPGLLNGCESNLKHMEESRDKRGQASEAYAAALSSVSTCKEMLRQLGNDNYDEAAAVAAENVSRTAEENKTNCVRRLSAAEKTKEDIERALPQINLLKEKIAALTKRQSGFDRLSKLFRSHSLFEFVADEYVNEFALIASDILQRLSGGLYTLEYENKEFYISDFMYDGKKRKAKTLSGGETFLASMSVAIAIMKYVSAGKSFEFFFLDEGFGTLHEGAVDIAVSALKELAKDVTVGVISHVDGIREGIATRITVKHATEDAGSIITYE